MAELLIWSRSTSEEDLHSLSGLLRAELPDCDVVFDEWRVLEREVSRLASSAYDAAEIARQRAADRGVNRAPEVFDVVTLVLPAVTTLVVQSVVDAAVRWLRGLREPPASERAVVIYGPNGEPLRKIRVRDPGGEPEVFAPPWPLPRRRGED